MTTKKVGRTTNPVSQCPTCGSPVRVVGSPDFIGDDVDEMTACTMHFEPISAKETWYLQEIGRLICLMDETHLEIGRIEGCEGWHDQWCRASCKWWRVCAVLVDVSLRSDHSANAETGGKDETVHQLHKW